MACYNACPVGAIYTGYDENGFETVNIDEDKCIDCKKCTEVCKKRTDVKRNVAGLCYAAQMNNTAALMKSASGGAFQALADSVLEAGGVCYGCFAEIDENGYGAKHIRIDGRDDLEKILNSKYIPSLVFNAYSLALEDLKAGKTVLFSGTPCQIEGLYVKKAF